MTSSAAPSAAAVARRLRARILAGEFDGTGVVPSRGQLADTEGITVEVASLVLRALEADGWVWLHQGRRTRLRPRRLFEVSVTVARTEGAGDGPAGLRELAGRAVASAAAAEPAGVVAEASASQQRLVLRLRVQATSWAGATRIAEAVLESMDEPWSWDGWDLPGAAVSAKPT